MVQILPEEPSLAKLLGYGIGQGVQTGFEGALQNYLKQQTQQQQFKSLQNLLGFEPSQEVTAPIEKNITQERPVQTNIERIATNPAAMTALTQMNPQVANQIQKMYDAQLAREKFAFEKHKQQLKESPVTPEMKQRMATAIESQLNLLKTGDIGLGQSYKLLTEKGRENRAEFDTYRASIESVLLPLLNKGVLSKPRFEFILKNIPSSNDTVGKIKGKIKALNREFGLNIDVPEIGTKILTKDIAQKFLKATNGDKEKAREMAKKSGYKF